MIYNLDFFFNLIYLLGKILLYAKMLCVWPIEVHQNPHVYLKDCGFLFLLLRLGQPFLTNHLCNCLFPPQMNHIFVTGNIFLK